mmetsp:Transcript_16973/g.21157  ORF Transcript_16973/g.21157 Transcript_16973/m.21157 type:complete len:402 (+) Transcript_16973:90-1295(+)
MSESIIYHEVPSIRTLKKAMVYGLATYAAVFFLAMNYNLAVNYHPNYRFRELLSDYRFRFKARMRRAGEHLSSQKFRKVQRRTKEGTEEEKKELDIVWQVSYQFAGSRVGIRILQDYTGYSMGTNYGDLMDTNRGFITKFYESIPIYPDRPNGPYKYRYDKPLPTSGNVLVRTHCSGYCVDYDTASCTFRDYTIPLTDLDYFFKTCATGTRFTQPRGRLELVRYDQWRVKKMMVLMRNPADLVLAKFISFMEFNPKTYPVNERGLQAWCDDYDNRHGSKQLRNYYSSEALKLVNTDGFYAMCEAELWRITRFYNQVFKLVEFLKDDVHPVYFEDYETDLETTITGMMDFLDYKQTENQTQTPFNKSGDGYPYYSEAQKANMMKFILTEASTATKERFQRYF